MPVVTMPKFGMTMEEGAIVRWHRQPGETIKKGEVLLEIESDKAVMEVQSDFTGTVVKYLAPENQLLKCGTPIAEID
jgi:pyruvate/2-oxoglutarate dehydrogenase complex dihydrolipoamide acyltransferase (E2) component